MFPCLLFSGNIVAETKFAFQEAHALFPKQIEKHFDGINMLSRVSQPRSQGFLGACEFPSFTKSHVSAMRNIVIQISDHI